MQKFKVGDWVVCMPGFTSQGHGSSEDIPDRGGSGYQKNLIFKIKNIDIYSKESNSVAWKTEGSNGVYLRSLRLATPWEIEHKQIQKEELYEIY